jgi:hypothetical protein
MKQTPDAAIVASRAHDARANPCYRYRLGSLASAGGGNKIGFRTSAFASVTAMMMSVATKLRCPLLCKVKMSHRTDKVFAHSLRLNSTGHCSACSLDTLAFDFCRAFESCLLLKAQKIMLPIQRRENIRVLPRLRHAPARSCVPPIMVQAYRPKHSLKVTSPFSTRIGLVAAQEGRGISATKWKVR